MQSFSKDSPSLSVSWRHGQSMFRKAANDFFYFLLCYISTKPTMTPKPISCFPFPGRTSLDDWARSCMVSAVSLWPKSDVAETTASWAQSADPTAHLWWKKRRFLVIIFFHQKQFSAGFVSQNDPRLCPIKNRAGARAGNFPEHSVRKARNGEQGTKILSATLNCHISSPACVTAGWGLVTE